MTYDRETSSYTFRYTSSTRLAPTDKSEYVPKLADITELFLPSRTYGSADKVRYQLSIGGRILFDLDNDRAYVWFIDSPAVARGRPQMTRRVDIWSPEVSARARKGTPLWQWIAYFLTFAFIAGAGWQFQQMQWENESAQGIQSKLKWGF